MNNKTTGYSLLFFAFGIEFVLCSGRILSSKVVGKTQPKFIFSKE